MKIYLPILKKCPIFKSLDKAFILRAIVALNGHKKKFTKNEIIYNYQESIQYAGIVLDGIISETMVNFSNNEYGLAHYKQGDIFGVSYSIFPSEKSLVQFVSKNNSSILFLEFSDLFNQRAIHCPKFSRLTSNLLLESYKDNIIQNKNIQILIQKHIRSKLIIYFSSLEAKNNIITPPFNRQELANHLAVERSALSRELCRMKREGLITFKKNKIHILKESLLNLE